MGFSGITSAGQGFDVGGTNAAGMPLGTPANGIGSLNTALITSSVISGLGDIANQFINAGRVKATAKFNQGMAAIQGEMVKTVAKYEIARIRKKSDTLYSKQRAIYAKAGVTFDGSPAEVMKDSLKSGELDAFTINMNAEMQAWSYNAQAKINVNEASGATGAASVNSAKTILQTASFIGAR